MIECPACSSQKAKLTSELAYSQKTYRKFKNSPPYKLYKCDDCGHFWISLEGSSTEIIEAHYDDDNYAGYQVDNYFISVIQQELTNSLIPRIAPPAKCLDVGCGNGEFLSAAQEAGYKSFGIDISPAAVKHCLKRGLEAQQGDFTKFSPKEPFDLITMWDVIEHLPEPRKFIAQAYSLLKPGGYLLIKTPFVSLLSLQIVKAIPRLSGTLTQAPGHIQFFNSNSMHTLLKECGFNELYWMESRSMRSVSPNRSLKFKISRLIKKLIHKFGKDGNLYLLAKKQVMTTN